MYFGAGEGAREPLIFGARGVLDTEGVSDMDGELVLLTVNPGLLVTDGDTEGLGDTSKSQLGAFGIFQIPVVLSHFVYVESPTYPSTHRNSTAPFIRIASNVSYSMMGGSEQGLHATMMGG